MNRFILIDQSLSGSGGHHFECAQLLLSAAEQRGWAPIVVAHRSFKQEDGWPARWPVTRVFRDTAYNRFSVITGVAERPMNPFEGWTNDFRSSRPWWRWRRWSETIDAVVRRFRQRLRLHAQVRALQAFWESLQPRRGDVAFLQTVNEYDLVWFSRFLAATPTTEQIDWHLQFHNNFLEGRDAAHAGQVGRMVDMQRHFWSLLQHFPRHRLHFYGTTRAMTRQYAALGAVPFEVLECPAHPDFAKAAQQALVQGDVSEPPESRPLRVVCGGYGRQEKGWSSLAKIVDATWSELFESGRCELQVQTSTPPNPAKRRKWRRRKARIQPGLADASNASVDELERTIAARAASAARTGSTSPLPIRRQPYPMPPDDYRRFLCEAHIGLFPYDAQRYFARYSAVLVEFLCAGVPVIVPAATWLAEQIAEAEQRHVAEMRRQGIALAAARPRPGDIWEFPKSTSELVLEFRGRGIPPGAYASALVVQFNEQGREVERRRLIDRPLPGRDVWAALVHRAPGASGVAVQISDLDGDRQGAAPNGGQRWELVGVEALAPASAWPLGRPLSAVGLTAANDEEFARQLLEMCRFFRHYQASARRFSADFSQRHTGEAIFDQLIESSIPASAKTRSAA